MNLKELEKWFKDRPKWLQDAACRLIQNGILTDNDFKNLFSICFAESNRQPVTFTSIPTGALGFQETSEVIRLISISDIQGINALQPTKPLAFGNEPICIVYGRNGAGKSGYVRLLKHACGTQRTGDLLTDIFNTTVQKQSANISFSVNSIPKNVQWTGQTLAELQGVDIYDTTCGLYYVNEENQVAFEPWVLRLFTQLTDACGKLSQIIEQQINISVSKKPIMPIEFSTTNMSIWYQSISSKTTTGEVDDKAEWNNGNEAELTEINKRLAEPNPAQKSNLLRRQKINVVELLDILGKIYVGLSDDKCGKYIEAKLDLGVKSKTAAQDAKKVFENSPLDGVGSESWRLLWEAAKKYSIEYAYKSIPFPNIQTDARCLLCQRELDEESRNRFTEFETFVNSELQNQVDEAEEKLQEILNAFPKIPSEDELDLKMDAAGINNAQGRKIISDFVSKINLRNASCLIAKKLEEITELPENEIFEQLEEYAKAKETKAIQYDEDAKGENRNQLEVTQKELNTKKWINQQRQAIYDEINRLTAIDKLQSANRLTSTYALSVKKSILTEELISKSYIKRFNCELENLMADDIKVELKKTRAEVGRVFHKIVLKNACKNPKTSDILSEGEFRIVSIAAFLADTEGRGAKATFVFDDPISSLDQVFEEAISKRLVELSKTRQVIVFTHRLSLLGLLEKYTTKEGVKKSIVCLSHNRVGEISELPINLTKTKQAANKLLNERTKAAKNAFQISDDEYEKEAKALCRDIRILMEQVVENDLLAGIVRRYNPEVQTKNKIGILAKITDDDCRFVDDVITEYSRYEHSQSEESPVAFPKPDIIEKRLRDIVLFIETVQNRNK